MTTSDDTATVPAGAGGADPAGAGAARAAGSGAAGAGDGLASPTPDALAARALELSRGGQGQEAVDALTSAAGGDRALLEAARDQMAARVRAAVNDWDATTALTLLNRTLSLLPRHDPLDWRVRWTQRFRKP